MYINKLDEIFDKYLDKFNIFLIKKKFFEKSLKDINFVKYLNEIIKLIYDFVNSIPKKEILDIVIKQTNYEFIINTIKRYCAFYIYLGIGYYYKDDRDLFITNLIESGKSQNISKLQIENFFNSDNNSKIIRYYTDIKHIRKLQEFKTMERIKIVLNNNPRGFSTTIELFEKLGEDFIEKNFLIKNNFHNILKTIIFIEIYKNEEKIEVLNILNSQEKVHSKYIYIEIATSKKDKIADFSVLQNFLYLNKYKNVKAHQLYSYLEEYKDIKDLEIINNKKLVQKLIKSKILIPITEEFLRYHKNSFKYTTQSIVSDNLKERDATKIKFVLNQVNQVKNLYSEIYKKNAKLKIKAMEFFYKPLSKRDIILYNNDEEIKIIQKLELSDQTTDKDLLVDLENIREYNYLSYKNLSKEGLNVRVNDLVQTIRYTNIKHEEKSRIELRIANSNIPINIIGLAYNPKNIPLECYNIKNLINVNKLYNKKNGYKSFLNIINQTNINKINKRCLYYWIFNKENDKIKLNEYRNISSLDNQKHYNIVISEIYKKYSNVIKNKIIKEIDNIKDISIWKLNKILRKYNKKQIFIRNEDKNKIINYAINKIEIIKFERDEVDDLIPGRKGKIILLPKVNIDKYKENIILVEKKKETETIDLKKKNIPLCYHYVKWDKILFMSRRSENKNQEIFNFVKKYVKENNSGDFVCKSCGEHLNLRKYEVEGTYIKELDTFLTTSLAVNQNLKDIPKYSKLTRTVNNIDKNIEKISRSINLQNYLGNDSIIKLKRRLLTKETIDLILIHTEYIKNQPKNRIELANKKYNIHQKLTNLFFFPLSDDIFLTSSSDTDYYKKIKFNNVILYITLLIISDLNPGKILSFKDDKRCNYFLYSKIGKNIMKDLFIRTGIKEKISLSKIPLLSYIIFYFSCILTNNNIWLWENKDDTKGYSFTIQNTIIHSIVDLINSIIEANFEEGKNFLYEIISTRINVKIKTLFNDKQILQIIENNSMDKIRIDSDTKKIKYVTKKIKEIILTGKFNENILPKHFSKFCETKTVFLPSSKYTKFKNKLDLITNCRDGNFHEWIIKNNIMTCKKCNEKYKTVSKLAKTSTSESDNINILKKINLSKILKLTKTFCISGKVHDIDDITKKCKLCNIDPNKYNYKEKELIQLGKNFKNINNQKIFKNIELSKEKYKDYNNNKIKKEKIISKFNKKYLDYTKNNIENYISDFIEYIEKILGNKIKIYNKEIFLKETIYIIDHDYLGNRISENIILTSKNNKILLEKNNSNYKMDVLYYKDRNKRVTVYYSASTKQYLGYYNGKSYNNIRSQVYLKINYSLKDMILLLGFENEYENIHKLNSYTKTMSKDEINDISKEIIERTIRNRVYKLKYILKKIISIIYSIKNHKKTSNNNFKETLLIREFTKILKNFNCSCKDNEKKYLFKHYKTILNTLKIDKIPEKFNLEFTKNYFNNNFIHKLNNSDSKIIFIIIYNLKKLIEYNSQLAIKSNICYLIIKIIKLMFDIFYVKIENIQIRQFDSLLLIDKEIIDDTVKGKGYYQELLSKDEIDDPEEKERDYDYNEEKSALDIDDFEINDDIDESVEALGY